MRDERGREIQVQWGAQNTLMGAILPALNPNPPTCLRITEKKHNLIKTTALFKSLLLVPFDEFYGRVVGESRTRLCLSCYGIIDTLEYVRAKNLRLTITGVYY